MVGILRAIAWSGDIGSDIGDDAERVGEAERRGRAAISSGDIERRYRAAKPSVDIDWRCRAVGYRLVRALIVGHAAEAGDEVVMALRAVVGLG